tara:strand:- start:1128 stop:1943 length:816 start_codon:yes stop_codon:yes gene_type:complete
VSTYAVGDVQGCYQELVQLLKEIGFNPKQDTIWFLGDLVNRGPSSLEVVQLVRSFGESSKLVLGNHDLHFLAIYFGGHSANKNDTFIDLLEATEVDQIANWYCKQPLLAIDKNLGYAMVHAGIPHFWGLKKALSLASEVSTQINGAQRIDFFRRMYGNKPDVWSDDLKGMDRLRLITNYLTRMRLTNDQGQLNFSHKGQLSDAPPGWHPWYQLKRKKSLEFTVLFGHWAALNNGTGRSDVIALDTGCVWGRELTAFCLETKQIYSVPSQLN